MIFFCPRFPITSKALREFRVRGVLGHPHTALSTAAAHGFGCPDRVGTPVWRRSTELPRCSALLTQRGRACGGPALRPAGCGCRRASAARNDGAFCPHRFLFFCAHFLRTVHGGPSAPASYGCLSPRGEAAGSRGVEPPCILQDFMHSRFAGSGSNCLEGGARAGSWQGPAALPRR